MLRLLLLVVFSATVFLAGCGKSPPPLAQVHGKVSLDNKPLPEGNIVFITVGASQETLPIKDGVYEGKVVSGERRVEILAYKDAPSVTMEGVPDKPNKENYLHQRYNTKTTLKAEVKPGVPNEFNFDLKSD